VTAPSSPAELDAADLLRLCAFLDPSHPIPIAVLDDAAGAVPARLTAALLEPDGRERMFDALLDAGSGGLAGSEVVLRPAAAAAAREALDPEARRAWAAAAVAAMERAFPLDPIRDEDRATAGILLPHAIAAATHALDEGWALGPAAQLLYLAGRYVLEVNGDFGTARELLERAVAAREGAHGAADARVAFDLNYLNGAQLHLGEWEAMAAKATRAAENLEGELGPRDRTVITHVNNAALLLARAGDRVRARAWFTRALALAEPVFGKQHPFCATILSNLGDLDRAEGDLLAARGAYGRALVIDQAAYGPRHSSVARDLAKLGEVLVEAGEHAAARGPLESALAWIVESEGADDVRAAQLRDLLARLNDPPQPEPRPS
jgi:tetratricopeptide (TPR) repeat protein